MKNSILKTSTKIVAFASVLLVIFLIQSCKKDDTGASLSAMFNLSSNGNSSQVVPSPSGANSNANGTFSGSYDSSTNLMTYTTTWANLTTAPVSSSLYNGANGVRGSLVASLALGANLNAASGSISGSVTLDATQEAQLLQGNLYFLIATSTNVSGEIRGQITAQKR